MRIALPLSLAAILLATPALAATAPADAPQSRRTAQPAKPAQATRTAPGSARTAAHAVPATRGPSTTANGATGSRRTSATSHGPARAATARGHGYASGVESTHPGLGPTDGEEATPQLVRFPGTVPGDLPKVLQGGPTAGAPGGYCGQMLMPAVALREVSRGFSRGHVGIDLMAPHGSPIHAAAAGTVIYAGWYFAYGNIVDIRHADGVVTRYAHMSAFAPAISAGAPVAAGEEIGKVGATGRAHGAHVHFEVRVDGRAVDPRPYLALASCDGTSPRDEILEAYADERPARPARRQATRARQASHTQPQPARQ